MLEAMLRGLTLVVVCAGSAAQAAPCERLAVDATTLYFLDGPSLFAAPRAGGETDLVVDTAAAPGGGCLVSDGARPARSCSR
jgi:hypothetical protein